MFITESMRILAASAAFLISSALCSSGSVGACTTSNPASRAILKRSAMLSFAGNISNQTPFLMESVGGNNRVSEGTLRSEEHTSELQSRLHLVCRLLLEKKNKYISSLLTRAEHTH